MAAFICRPVQYVTVTGSGAGAHPATIDAVHGDGTVDVWGPNSGGNTLVRNVPYVAIGGTAPTGVPYVQEVALS